MSVELFDGSPSIETEQVYVIIDTSHCKGLILLVQQCRCSQTTLAHEEALLSLATRGAVLLDESIQ